MRPRTTPAGDFRRGPAKPSAASRHSSGGPVADVQPADDIPTPLRLVDALDVAAVQSADAALRAAILRGLQDRLWRVCRSLLDSADAAEDAVQETAARLLDKLPGFDGRSKLSTWATGVAVNVCRETRRRERRRNLLRLWRPRDAEDPAGDDELARLRVALADLPPRQREAVVLRYLEGLDVRQTAALMGCAPGSVKAGVHAGLKALRARLEDDQAR